MCGLSHWELILILAVALVVLGPRRLPGLAKSIGKGLRDLRRASNDLRSAIEEPLDEIRRPLEDMRSDLVDTIRNIEDQIEAEAQQSDDEAGGRPKRALTDHTPQLEEGNKQPLAEGTGRQTPDREGNSELSEGKRVSQTPEEAASNTESERMKAVEQMYAAQAVADENEPQAEITALGGATPISNNLEHPRPSQEGKNLEKVTDTPAHHDPSLAKKA